MDLQLTQFIASLNARGLSEKSQAIYVGLIRKFFKTTGLDTSTVTKAALDDYVARLVLSRRLQFRYGWTRFCEYARREGVELPGFDRIAAVRAIPQLYPILVEHLPVLVRHGLSINKVPYMLLRHVYYELDVRMRGWPRPGACTFLEPASSQRLAARWIPLAIQESIARPHVESLVNWGHPTFPRNADAPFIPAAPGLLVPMSRKNLRWILEAAATPAESAAAD